MRAVKGSAEPSMDVTTEPAFFTAFISAMFGMTVDMIASPVIILHWNAPSGCLIPPSMTVLSANTAEPITNM